MATANATLVTFPVKLCSKCKTEKPFDAFQRCRPCKDGYYPWCKACRAAIYARRKADLSAVRRAKYAALSQVERQKILDYNKAWRNKNAEKLRQTACRRWRESERKRILTAEWKRKNKEKVREHRRKTWAKHGHKYNVKNREYWWKNRERLVQQCRDYYRQNKHLHHAYRHKREARIAGLPCDFTKKDLKAAIAYWCGCCAICDVPFGLLAVPNIDHWIPLSSEACIGTVPENMLPLCRLCNSSKHDNEPETWLVGFLGERKAKAKRKKIAAFFQSVRKVTVPPSP